MMQYQAAHDEFPLVLNCLDILSEDKDAATSSTADSLLKNIFCFNFVLGIMTLSQPAQQYLFLIFYLHLLSTAVPAAATHLPRAQSEVGAGRGGDQPVRGGDTLGCLVSAQLVAVWLLCEKYRYDLLYLASVLRSLVLSVMEVFFFSFMLKPLHYISATKFIPLAII